MFVAIWFICLREPCLLQIILIHIFLSRANLFLNALAKHSLATHFICFTHNIRYYNKVSAYLII